MENQPRGRNNTLCVDPTEHVIHQIFLPAQKHKNWRAMLPELTKSDPINVQLYAFIGLICRQFIQSWHSNITNDKTFVQEILETLSSVVQNVEERSARVDFNEMILNGLPGLLQSHIKDIREANMRVNTGVMPIESVERAFHSLRPHPALDTGEESEQLFRKVLAKGLMVVLIDDNIQSAAARTLVSSVINEIALKTAVERLSEPWMVYEIIIKLVSLLPEENETQQEKQPDKPPQPITMQIGEYYKKALEVFGKTIALGGKSLAYFVSLSNEPAPGSNQQNATPPVMSSIFSCISTLLKLDHRNPLLVSTLGTLSIPFRKGKLGELSTKAANRVISQTICNERAVVAILKAARENLFPNNGPMGPSRVLPTEQEQREIRQRAKHRLLTRVPDKVKLVLFGQDRDQAVDELLDLFANKQINKHLVYNIIDYLVVTLIPELAEKTPVQIQTERL